MRNNKRHGSIFGVYQKSVFIIFMFLLFFVAVIGINALSLSAKNREYQRQEAEIKAQIEAQKERADEMDEFREYVKSSEYEKEIAQEKFGLVDPDEIIFKASD